MVESKELHSEIDEILMHVRSIDGQIPWLIISQIEKLEHLLIDYFTKKRRTAKVYLATDGKRTVSKIGEFLGLHQEAVSKELKELEDRGLVEQKKWGIYRKTKVDTTIGLSNKLRKELKLQDVV